MPSGVREKLQMPFILRYGFCDVLRLFMVALCNRADHYILPCDFYLFIFFFFFYSSPNLSGHRLDVYHTSTHGVDKVQI